MLVKLALLCAFLSLSLAACGSSGDGVGDTKVPSQAEVEIDMTSGLPPPTWTLTSSEVEQLEELLESLPSTDSGYFFDGLGYRGFVIKMNSPQRLIRVQNGNVLVEEEDTKRVYIDAENQLEKWLLNTSKPHIEPQLYSLLEENMGR